MFSKFLIHLPILQVMLPLAVAPLLTVLRWPQFAWAMTVLTGIAAFAGAMTLLSMTLTTGVISYHLGAWPPPWGIELRIDVLNAFVLVLVSGISAVTFIYARRSVAREIAPDAQPLFYTMLLLCFAGMLGITITGDAFNLFVFLEIASLSAYVLVAMGANQDKRALTAAYTYLIMGTIGASFYVIGLGLLYMITGTLNMADIAARIAGMTDSRTLHMAFAFVIIGFALKFALFPMHLWLPNAYTYAPSTVSVFLSGVAAKVAIYAALRFTYTVFSMDFLFVAQTLKFIYLPLGIAAIIFASAVAIFQTNVKRILAYSSLAQIGYITLGVSFANLTGLMAAIIQLFNHAMMKGGLFMAVGCVVYRTGSSSIASFRGLGHQMPWTMAAFVIGGLSLVGMPATIGFVGKWYLLIGAFEAGWWPVVAAMVVGSILTLVYVWRIIEAAYLQPAPDGQHVAEAPLSMLVPLWALTISCLALGIDSEFTVSVARVAAETLFHDPHLGLPVKAGL